MFHSLNVLWLVLVGDGNIPATGYQINGATLAKLLIVNRKCEFHNSVNVIIPVMVLILLKIESRNKLTVSMPNSGADPHPHLPYLED